MMPLRAMLAASLVELLFRPCPTAQGEPAESLTRSATSSAFADDVA